MKYVVREGLGDVWVMSWKDCPCKTHVKNIYDQKLGLSQVSLFVDHCVSLSMLLLVGDLLFICIGHTA